MTETTVRVIGPSMTHAEAIAALDLIVHRADQTVPGHRGIKSVAFTSEEIAAAKAALKVLNG